MQVINSGTGRVTLLGRGDELLLGRGLTVLSESLEIALAKFYRQSNNKVARSASAEEEGGSDYTQKSHLAPNAFGLVLAENHYGVYGYQTFFEEFPSAAYLIIEGKGQFAQTPNNFYRLGLVCAAVNGLENTYLGIDPIYNRAGIRTALFSAQSDDKLFQVLNEHYGGSWRADQIFHPETGKYEWLENRTIRSFFPKKKE